MRRVYNYLMGGFKEFQSCRLCEPDLTSKVYLKHHAVTAQQHSHRGHWHIVGYQDELGAHSAGAETSQQ